MSEMKSSLPGQADDGARADRRPLMAGQGYKSATAHEATKQEHGLLARFLKSCAAGTALAALARPVLAQGEQQAAASAHLFTSTQVVGVSV
ncbi:alkaline phosphatase, partial [Rhizobium ruizarguesonis]